MIYINGVVVSVAIPVRIVCRDGVVHIVKIVTTSVGGTDGNGHIGEYERLLAMPLVLLSINVQLHGVEATPYRVCGR